MRDDITMESRLSLAEPKHKMIPVGAPEEFTPNMVYILQWIVASSA